MGFLDDLRRWGDAGLPDGASWREIRARNARKGPSTCGSWLHGTHNLRSVRDYLMAGHDPMAGRVALYGLSMESQNWVHRWALHTASFDSGVSFDEIPEEHICAVSPQLWIRKDERPSLRSKSEPEAKVFSYSFQPDDIVFTAVNWHEPLGVIFTLQFCGEAELVLSAVGEDLGHGHVIAGIPVTSNGGNITVKPGVLFTFPEYSR